MLKNRLKLFIYSGPIQDIDQEFNQTKKRPVRQADVSNIVGNQSLMAVLFAEERQCDLYRLCIASSRMV